MKLKTRPEILFDLSLRKRPAYKTLPKSFNVSKVIAKVALDILKASKIRLLQLHNELAVNY